jgi:hypothetical protein
MKLNYILSLLIASVFFTLPNIAAAQSSTYIRMINTSEKVVRGRIIGMEEFRYD